MREFVWTVLAFGMGCNSEGELEELEPFTDDVFFLEVTSSTATACETEVTHNFVDAEVATSDGVFEDELEVLSPAGSYAYVTRRGENELVLHLDGQVFVGEYVDGETIDVGWESRTDASSTITSGGGYRFDGTEDAAVIESLSFAPSRDGLTGTMTIEQTLELDGVETDQWNASSGVITSSLQTFGYLEPVDGFGFVRNQAESADCEGETCALVVSEVCATELQVMAWPIDGGLATFEALSGFQRPAGAPGAGFP